MDPNLEIVTLFTRIGLKADLMSIFLCYRGNFVLNKDTRKEIEWLKGRMEVYKVKKLLDDFYGIYSNSMLSIIQEETINAKTFLKLRRMTERTFKNCRRIKSFIRIREIIHNLRQKFAKRAKKDGRFIITKKIPESERGLTVAFLGQDGAGKTTVTKQLIEWWSWKLDVHYVYLGSGENYYSWKKSVSHKLSNNRNLKYLAALVGIYDIKELVKKAYRNVMKAEIYAKKGGLVIYDRFPQMNYPGICDGPKIRGIVCSRLGNGLLARLLIPLACTEEKYIRRIINQPPDLVFKLLLPPEESIRRKPKEKIEAVTKKHKIVSSLDFTSSKIYTIDATMPFDEEMLMIKRIIWQQIQ